jgi:lipopolysaccharide/colanic/teichoic acid biosynthesis glycosyltransferase
MSDLPSPRTSGREPRTGYTAAKRGLDVVLATVLLMVTAPLLIVVALTVWITSPGSAIFRQKRVGMSGRLFEILKFRTMTAVQGANKPPITAAGDKRITRLGQLLRRYKLDELPQLINIIKGEMSFVGPRPELPEFVALFANDYADILRVRPGLTDYAAIRFRNEEDLLAASGDPVRTYVEVFLPQKIALYRQYLATRSMWVDLVLMVQTCWSVVRPDR